MSTHFLNGVFVSEDELRISPRDLGFARGYAIFDFLKTYPLQRPFRLDRHIDRLFNSAEAIALSMPWSKKEIRELILETLSKNKTEDEKFIKIMVSGGVSDSLLPPEKPTLVILVDPAVSYPQGNYENGVSVLPVEFQRYRPEAKTNNYIEAVTHAKQAHAMKAGDPLYYSDGMVREGARSNVFALINGKLLTPKSSILEGITREVLLEILKLDVPVMVEDFSFDALKSASEIFLSGSGIEITPVTRIGDTPVGEGSVGPVTKEVMKQFHDYTHSDEWAV